METRGTGVIFQCFLVFSSFGGYKDAQDFSLVLSILFHLCAEQKRVEKDQNQPGVKGSEGTGAASIDTP